MDAKALQKANDDLAKVEMELEGAKGKMAEVEAAIQVAVGDGKQTVPMDSLKRAWSWVFTENGSSWPMVLTMMSKKRWR